MTQAQSKIAVVGAGITGLAAAFYLQKRGQEEHCPVDITIIEQQDKPGGKVQTMQKDGFVIERGPDSFLARKPEMTALVQELGLEQELAALNAKAGSASILHQGQFHAIPPGFVMGVPTKLRPFLQTSLLSLSGKARAALDLALPRGSSKEDEALGEFLQKRLGKEVVTQIAEPLLSGIYAGDLYGLSTKATFPQFLSLQHKYRSLILGMRQSQGGAKKPPAVLPQSLQKSPFLHLRQGLSAVIDALVAHLQDQQLLLRTEVTSIRKDKGRYRLVLGGTEELEADAVIIASPPFRAAQLLKDHPVASQLSEVKHASVANVILGYHKKPNAAFRGTGFLVPRNEGRFMTACTFTSDKWLHTAPEQGALIRCYVGRAGQEDWIHLSDEEIAARVLQELQAFIGLDSSPDFQTVTRWPKAMPQYTPGHLERLAEIRAQIGKDLPGIYLAGAGYGGVGLPDCVRQGSEAAALAAEYLMKK